MASCCVCKRLYRHAFGNKASWTYLMNCLSGLRERLHSSSCLTSTCKQHVEQGDLQVKCCGDIKVELPPGSRLLQTLC